MYANPSSTGRAPGAQLGNTRPRGLSGPPAGVAGDVVTVGGDVTMGNPIRIRADDTGQLWTVLDVSGTGWVGLQPPLGPITRGVVRGTVSAPYTIGRVDAAGKYSAGERGTTLFTTAAPVVVRVYTLPNGSTRPLRQFDLYYPGHPGEPSANPPIMAGGDPDQIRFLNRSLLPAFIEDMKARLAAGEITTAYAQMVAQRAIDLGWQPPPGSENAFWLPPGGGDVPFALQGAVTDTGAIHPDALTPEAQARMNEVLRYTAEMRGTTFEEEAARAAAQIRALNPGETFEGVEQFLAAMQRGEFVQLTPDAATNTRPTVDERPLSEKMADPYGVGAGSVYYDLAPAGTPGKDGAPGMSIAGVRITPTLLGLAALGLLLAAPAKPTRKGGRR